MSEVPASTLTPDQTKSRLDACLAEYDKLKSEQAQRIGLRDNLVYAMLVSTAAVVAFSFQGEGDPIGLLALPFACFILGWLHVVNDEKSRAIGQYLRNELSLSLLDLTGKDAPGILGWENRVRSGASRRRRKQIQLASDLVTFVATGFLALFLYWFPAAAAQVLLLRSAALREFTPLAFSLIGLHTLVFLAREIVRGADIPPKPQPQEE